MTLARTLGIALSGIDGQLVEIEAELSSGLPGLSFTGLADTTVNESRDRIRAAVGNAGVDWPNRKITIALLPADVRKVGSRFDLGLAIAVLASADEVPVPAVADVLWIAELGLDGRLRPVRGVLPAIVAARMAGVTKAVVAPANAAEAALVEDMDVRTAHDLGEIVRWLRGEQSALPTATAPDRIHDAPPDLDLSDVAGQSSAKRALEIAAAGAHHLYLVGPPGAGKTMLAERLPGLLPALDDKAALEVTAVHSVAGRLAERAHLIRRAPLQAPHHTASVPALVGGGSNLARPGAISLAQSTVYSCYMTIRAGIYTRISDDREVAGQGVGRQDDDCRALAVKLGWEVAGVYPENDTSAFKRRTVKLADGTRVSRVVRPVFDRLLNDLRSGLLDALIADDLDRIARDPRDLEDLIDVVEERNIATATVSGATDLSTDNGVTMARIMVGIANKSSRDTRRRIERKHLQLAREGKMSGGGTRPFGYEDDRLTIREDEAAVIRDAAARVLAGESVRGIARDWVSRPIATVTGAKWSTHVVRSILRSARIAGLREHQGHVVVGKNGRPVEAEWPAIVDIKTHERLRVLLDDPARNKRGAGAGRKYLLSGLVECSLCGTRLISRPAQRRENGIVERQPSMVCASGPPFHGCGKLRIRAEWLEGVVSAAVVELLDGPSLNALVRAREDSGVEAQLQKALDEDREALTELARDRYTRRVIGDVEFISVRNELTQRIEDNARKLADAIDRSVLVDLPTGDGELALAWEDWTVDRRRAVIDAVVSNVIVRPGVRGRNKYTPEQIAERIEIKWTDD